MHKKADITFKENCFFLEGDLNFYNVMSVYEKSLPHIKSAPSLNFDFINVNSSDSSGLALIVEWSKLAKAQGKSIHFAHLSPELRSIAKSSGLDKIITIS